MSEGEFKHATYDRAVAMVHMQLLMLQALLMQQNNKLQ
jgi:hypothetical protein